MKDAITYIVETVVCSGVFVLLYRLLFSARVSYGFSRVYLMVSTVAAAVIPLLAIPVYPARVIEIAVPMIATPVAAVFEAGTVAETVHEFDWGVAALVLYTVMALAALTVLVCQTVRIESYKRGAEHTVEQGLDTYTSPRIRSSFSFLRSIFLTVGLAPTERTAIVVHERSHICHHHSADILLMSTLRALLWFNPFVWISYRSLVEVHEYEADRDSLKAGQEITAYRQLILKQLLGYNPDMTSGFATSLTKKRFIMMTKKKSKYAFLRYAAVVPVAAGMMMLFSFTRAADRYVSPAEQQQDEKYKTFATSGTRYATMTIGEYLREIGVLDRRGNQKEGTPLISPIFISYEAPQVGKAPETKDLDTYYASTFQFVRYVAEDSDKANPNPNGVLFFDVMLENLPSERNKKRSKDYVYSAVEQMPTFQGGDLSKFESWIYDNLNYESEAGYGGSMVLRFIVEPDGKLTRLPMSVDGLRNFVNAVTELVDRSPEWEPGRHDGKPVRVMYMLPLKSGRQTTGIKYNSFKTAGTRFATMTIGDYLRELGVWDSTGKRVEGTPTPIFIKVQSAGDYTESPEWSGKNYFSEVRYYAPGTHTPDMNKMYPYGTLEFTPVETDDDPFMKVEEMPTFQGGNLNAFREWIVDNVKYPEGSPTGMVVAEFIIERDGTLAWVKFLQDDKQNGKLNAAVEEVLNRSPKWTPGRQKGKLVRVKYILPVKFTQSAADADAQKQATISAAADIGRKTIGELINEIGESAGRVAIAVKTQDQALAVIPGSPYYEEGLKERPDEIGFSSANGNQTTFVVSGDTEYGKKVLADFYKSDAAKAKTAAVADDEPLMKVEQMPTFQGGDLNTFREWLGKQIELLPEKERLYGKVVLGFIIERDGSVSSIEHIQGDKRLSAQVEAALKNSPKWTAGRQDGKTVRVKYLLPVYFALPRGK